MSNRRFRIALSCAGEKRAFVAKVAAILADTFGEEAILYDTFHEAEFAIYNLGIRLPVLYGEQSDLFVPVLCPDYDQKRWTGWEWMHIYGLLNGDDGHRVMPCRFEHAHADGLSPAAGFIDLDGRTPEDIADRILERLALNEGKVKGHYINQRGRYRTVVSATSSPARSRADNSMPCCDLQRSLVGARSEFEGFSEQYEIARGGQAESRSRESAMKNGGAARI